MKTPAAAPAMLALLTPVGGGSDSPTGPADETCDLVTSTGFHPSTVHEHRRR